MTDKWKTLETMKLEGVVVALQETVKRLEKERAQAIQINGDILIQIGEKMVALEEDRDIWKTMCHSRGEEIDFLKAKRCAQGRHRFGTGCDACDKMEV